VALGDVLRSKIPIVAVFVALAASRLACHPAERCGDGIDNDRDGLVDCEDSFCFPETYDCSEDCANGVDDNEDGAIDCDDDRCWGHPACPERCWNEADDDHDGLVDCEDADCTCERCENGVDDDANGRVDCADRRCFDDPACEDVVVVDDGDPDTGEWGVQCRFPDEPPTTVVVPARLLDPETGCWGPTQPVEVDGALWVAWTCDLVREPLTFPAANGTCVQTPVQPAASDDWRADPRVADCAASPHCCEPLDADCPGYPEGAAPVAAWF
jgi:hypothetical protein